MRRTRWARGTTNRWENAPPFLWIFRLALKFPVFRPQLSDESEGYRLTVGSSSSHRHFSGRQFALVCFQIPDLRPSASGRTHQVRVLRQAVERLGRHFNLVKRYSGVGVKTGRSLIYILADIQLQVSRSFVGLGVTHS